MTKKNTLECWKPKNCGGSSKCGDCITLKFKLLADWEPNTEGGGDFPNAIGIATFQFALGKSPSTNFALFGVPIQPEAKKGAVFSVGICKSIITNNTLYYSIGDAYAEGRGESFIPFTVKTDKCVNEIPINNACPKSICGTTTITFVLTGAGNDYEFRGSTNYNYALTDNCGDYEETTAIIEDPPNQLILTNVVNTSISVKLDVQINGTLYDYKDQFLVVDLTQISSPNCTLTIKLPFRDFRETPPEETPFDETPPTATPFDETLPNATPSDETLLKATPSEATPLKT
jgi:hypothetical protein